MKKILIALSLLGGGVVIGTLITGVVKNAETNNVQNDLNVVTNDYDGLMVKYVTLQADHAEAKRTIIEIRDRIIIIEEIIKGLEQDLTDMTSQRDAKQAEVDELTQKLSEMTAERDSLSKQLSEMTAEKNKFEELLTKEQEKVSDLASKLASEIALKEQALNRIAELELKIKILMSNASANEDKLNKEIKILQEELTATKEIVKGLNNKISLLQSQLSEANKEIARLNNEINNLVAYINDLSTKYLNVSAELESTKKQLASAKQELETVKRDLQIMDNAWLQETKKNEKLTNDLKIANENYAKVSAELDSALEEIKRLEGTVQDYQNGYNEIYDRLDKIIQDHKRN